MEMTKILASLDKMNNGYINYNEFLAAGMNIN